MNRMRLAAAFLTAIAVALGSACAALPTEGDPHSFPIEVPARDPIGQYGSGPQAGSSPTVLVEDFLRACAAGAFDDYTTAKLYLLPETADRWKPTDRVTVFPTDQAPSTQVPVGGETEQSVTVAVPTIATVDAGGVLHELAGEGETSMTFELSRDSTGEWRIAGLEDGVVLSQNSFTTSFDNYNVYFPAATGDALVPDPRWLPRMRTSSHLVNAVLNGPNPRLAEAVMPDLGTGLALPTSGVHTQDRVAHVDLQGEAQKDREERVLLMWQIHQTLRQVPNVQATVLTINSVVVDPLDMPAGPSYALDRMVSIVDGSLVIGTLNGVGEVMPASTMPTEPRFPAVGPLEDSPVAWLGEQADTVYKLRPTRDIVEITVPSPSKPTIDRFENVWVVGNGGEALYIISPTDEVTTVESPITDTPLSAVFVSPDGARIALLAEGADGGSLWTGTVVPDGGGGYRITAIQQEERASGDVIDAAWNSSVGLSVLEALENDEVLVLNLPLGSWSSRFSGPSEGAWISAGQSGGLIVQREDQTAFQRAGSAWRDIGSQRAYVNTPG